MIRSVTSLVAALLLFVATPALAQNQRAARRHFQRAEAHFAAEEWQEAFNEYQAAYIAAPLPGLLFNMGQCERKLGNGPQALEYFEQYLQEMPDAPNRPDTEALIRELRGPTEPAAPEPAPEPEPAPQSAVTPEPAQPPASPPERSGGIGLPVWLLAAGGVVILGTGGFFALQATSAESDLNDTSLDCERELDRCLSLQEDGDRAAMLRNVFLGVGGAVLAGAAVLAILDLSSGPEEQPVAISPVVSQRAFALRLHMVW